MLFDERLRGALRFALPPRPPVSVHETAPFLSLGSRCGIKTRSLLFFLWPRFTGFPQSCPQASAQKDANFRQCNRTANSLTPALDRMHKRRMVDRPRKLRSAQHQREAGRGPPGRSVERERRRLAGREHARRGMQAQEAQWGAHTRAATEGQFSWRGFAGLTPHARPFHHTHQSQTCQQSSARHPAVATLNGSRSQGGRTPMCARRPSSRRPPPTHTARAACRSATPHDGRLAHRRPRTNHRAPPAQ